MSTVTQRERGAWQRWKVPAVCVLAAGAYLAVFLSIGQVATAITTAAIMLGYGAVLVIFSRRSEVAAILMGNGLDERRMTIHFRASALAFQVIGVFALTMAFVDLARGRAPGDWGTVCLVAGGTYLAGIVFFARRG